MDHHDNNSSDSDSEEATEEWTAERLSRASYKDVGSPQVVEQRFLRHLLSSPSCQSSLKVLLTSKSTTTRDYSLEIDAFDLLQADPILGHMLLKYPGTLLQLLENAIVMAQQHIREQLLQDDPTIKQQPPVIKGAKVDNHQGGGVHSTRVHARLVHLPPTCCMSSLASIQAADVGKIVQCSGTVVRTSPVCMYESCRTFKCAGKHGCGKTFYVHADLEQRNNALVTPERCKASSGGAVCKGHNFQPVVEGGSVHTDYQEVVIQESASQLVGSHVPRSLLIKLQHDLVDQCQPGDEVIVVGNLLAQWHQTVMADMDCQIGMALEAHSIRVVQDKSSSAWSSSSAGAGGTAVVIDMDEDKFYQEFVAFWQDPQNRAAPMAARDHICKAVCPKLYGLAIVKLALLMTLIGGVCQEDHDKRKRREAKNASSSNGIHATTGTSSNNIENEEPEPFQIVQNNNEQTSGTSSAYYGGEEGAHSKTNYQVENSNESVQTRRRGQSHLLLVGDPGTGKSQFLRFAAAICPRSVLTTGVGTTSAGLTCAAVREGNGGEFSLEAGALVLADQGVCCIDEFGCIQDSDKTTIHEAMEQQTLSVAKAGIVCKLNCRATIIAVMNPKGCIYDNQASLSRNTGLGTPLLSRFDVIFKMVDSSDAERDSNVTTYLLNRAIQGAGFECSLSEDATKDATWTMEKLRAYISVVREKFQPVMSDDAALLLERHYEKARSAQSSTIPVTVRFLESLIRLGQAHARLMFRQVVTLDDAVAVIRVMECSAFCYGGFDGNSADDFENVMYCDPVSVDFSVQPDVDFLCFKARILKRYSLEDRLTADEYRLINEALGHGSYAAGPYAQEWNTMESDRDRGVTRQDENQFPNNDPTKKRRFQ